MGWHPGNRSITPPLAIASATPRSFSKNGAAEGRQREGTTLDTGLINEEFPSIKSDVVSHAFSHGDDPSQYLTSYGNGPHEEMHERAISCF